MIDRLIDLTIQIQQIPAPTFGEGPRADAETDDARAPADASPDAQSQIESLQQSVGNQSVSRMVRSGAVQRTPLRAERAIRAQVQRQGKPKPAAPMIQNMSNPRRASTDRRRVPWGCGGSGLDAVAFIGQGSRLRDHELWTREPHRARAIVRPS